MEAAKAGLNRYFWESGAVTAISERYVLNGTCVECAMNSANRHRNEFACALKRVQEGKPMASSWIKVEVITPDKPEIFQIAEILVLIQMLFLEKLVRIWAWADQQTIDGNAGSVTKGVLDRLAFITGFADALISVGWLAYHDGKLIFQTLSDIMENHRKTCTYE